MTHSWIETECRNQAFLYLAAARFAAPSGKSGPAVRCPPPLLRKDSLLAKHVEAQLAGIVQAKAPPAARKRGWLLFGGAKAAIEPDASSLKTGRVPTTTKVGAQAQTKTPLDAAISDIQARVKKVFEDSEKRGGEVERDPWPLGTLVSWWVEAGHAMASLDTENRRALARIVADESGEHPALWCAERFHHRHLSVEAVRAEAGKPDWCKPFSELRHYKNKLFAWVIDPVRTRKDLPNMNQRPTECCLMLQTELQANLADAQALFANLQLEGGDSLSPETIVQWKECWFQRRFGETCCHILSAPIRISGQRTNYFKGRVLLPYASTLSHRLEGVINDPAIDVSFSLQNSRRHLSSAAQFLTTRWKSGTSVDEVRKAAAAVKHNPCAGELTDSIFLAAARLLTTAVVASERIAAEGERAKEIHDLTTGLRLAFAFEGFCLEKAEDAVQAPRRIPHLGGRTGDRTYVTLVCRNLCQAAGGASHRAHVGFYGLPATCSPGLFAAVDGVDWRLWAYQYAPSWWWNEDAAKIRDNVTRGAEKEGWEAIKQEALDTTGRAADEGALARLFTHAHQTRLTLEMWRDRAAEPQAGDVMLAGLIGEYRNLAKEALVALAEIDPEAPVRLDPPRFVDGQIDAKTWLSSISGSWSSAAVYTRRWQPSERPRGAVVDERGTPARSIEVVLSAGDLKQADIAFLNAPPLIARPASTGAAESATPQLPTVLIRFQHAIAFAVTDSPTTTDPVAELRDSLAKDAADAFDELVARGRNDDEAAKEWHRLLAADPRFDFSCHPAIDVDSGQVRAAAAEDSFLAWEFDPAVPRGGDIAVRFSLHAAGARRVISRGAREPGSLADRAERLVESGRQASAAMAALGERAREATDRWITFAERSTHPLSEAGPLLDELLRDENLSPACRNALFAAVTEWSAALDHHVHPVGWRADQPLMPETLGSPELPVEFDEKAAVGSVMVRSFGLRGSVCERPFVGVISAGPSPSGFMNFRLSVTRLGDSPGVGHTPSMHEVTRRTDELARHSLAGTLPLALPNLFERLWELFEVLPDRQPLSEAEAANAALREMLKSVCGMVLFEPATVGDYPSGWVRDPDGTQPRGRRIKRLVRPGLRTLESALVRPALAITE